MSGETMLFIIVYATLAFLMGLSEITVMGHLTKDKMFLVRPKFLYEHSEMNMFGCCLVTALFCVINPIGGIFRLIHFICTVGRKKK